MRLCLGSLSGDALLRGHVMFGYTNDNVAGALYVPERAAHWCGAQAFPARALVHKRAGHEKLVNIKCRAAVFSLALGISDCAPQDFFNVARSALGREAQNLQRAFGSLPANQVNHQAYFLR
jgi:hypothetical protein